MRQASKIFKQIEDLQHKGIITIPEKITSIKVDYKNKQLTLNEFTINLPNYELPEGVFTRQVN